ncbi:uncharacterized protein GVI51_L02519 [Nakaseomyces glabratus]|uniref:YEATS domain-containing protein n=2 Tax=Candida glabrata TaxID=5478 RepID=Q6FLK4_CANGA|nr:uncharacterized protein CAGL0L02739g [Nakaseomyces glabratus]KAH7581380.1 YEATS domain profile [Nakaseomyces glabratus]KAH7594942.1 YEATS domain profile [Nakaseomyces glabratus]KAH7595369.1 YEATS domain profile [Nakaseomyces glabratus]KAH7601801.1 YEATS domain profile [Nakaseomyces glabratus]KAH7611025.1 YEATS domain profile [Nakaseomyces glabratus]|eukprot:XP_448890.1 uncharacterized protein CAGL0L02739g [[Candida] glabrata]
MAFCTKSMGDNTIAITLRVKTQQSVLLDQQLEEGELPLRQWRVEVSMLDRNKDEVKADILSSVTYHLHPTFVKPRRKMKTPPFSLEEIGWGEFSMTLMCKFRHNGGVVKIQHELEFSEDAYIIDYSVNVPYLSEGPFYSLLARHFNVIPQNSVPVDNNIKQLPKWVKTLQLQDEDTINELLQRILSNAAVKNFVNKIPRHEEVVFCLGELPDELMNSLTEYMESTGDIK